MENVRREEEDTDPGPDPDPGPEPFSTGPGVFNSKDLSFREQETSSKNCKYQKSVILTPITDRVKAVSSLSGLFCCCRNTRVTVSQQPTDKMVI